MLLLCKENIWLNCRILYHIRLCKHYLTIVSDALNLHILNFDVRSQAFVTVLPIENRALFCPNCAFERCSSVNTCMCFLRTALPKGTEYSRGETNLNSFIHQVMFSSGIIARVCMGLRDIFQFAFFVFSQTRKINANNRNNKK